MIFTCDTPDMYHK